MRKYKDKAKVEAELWIFFLSLALTLTSTFAKAGESLQSIVKKVQARYEATSDFKAEFEQKTQIKGFTTPIVYKGRLYIKKPGMLRWDYSEPSKHQIYVNNEKVVYYIPEHKQAMTGLLSEDSGTETPTHLLSGLAKIDQDFDVSFEEDGEEKKDMGPRLRLIPKDKRTEISKIVIELEPKRSYIIRLTIFEKTGNSSTFNFTKIEANTGLKDDLFVFTPPKDVEMVDPRLFK
ncbi:MAG: outer membrane lipoprotein carrier protein LolA [Nitrospirota bacterium]